MSETFKGKLLSKILLLALCASMVITPLTACSDNNGGGGNDVTGETTKKEEEVKDMDGYEISFLTKEYETNSDVAAEELNEDPFNDAIYKRNQKLSEKYNFKVNLTMKADPVKNVKDSLLAGDDTYDVIYGSLNDMATLAEEGLLIDLYSLENFDFDANCWNQTVNSDLTIAHKLYFTYGDHMTQAKDATSAIFFSKKLVEDYKLGDLYALVDNNEWTIDKMKELCKGITKDLTGDGKTKSYKDQYALVTEGYSGLFYLIGCGDKIVKKDENDIPYIDFNTTETQNHFQTIFNLLGNKDYTVFPIGTDITDAEKIWTDFWMDGFTQNRILFRQGAMHDSGSLREMEKDFGILPTPKYNASQSRYYHTGAATIAEVFGISINSKEPEKVAYIIQKMAEDSHENLVPVYYDTILKGQITRDLKSEEMLDIIFNSVTYDLGVVYQWGNLQNIPILSVQNRKNNFSSAYQKAETQAKSELQKTIDTITSRS